jgi:hypothetical protein
MGIYATQLNCILVCSESACNKFMPSAESDLQNCFPTSNVTKRLYLKVILEIIQSSHWQNMLHNHEPSFNIHILEKLQWSAWGQKFVRRSENKRRR